MKTRYILMAAILLIAGCSKGGSNDLTSEEKAFAEKWNQWVDDHSEEMNAFRTRAIADDLSEEEIARGMISFMVRFSNEEDIDIPKRFIDDIKKKAGTSD